MANFVIANFDGGVILGHIQRSSIGSWNEAKIDQDITDKSVLSIVGESIDVFESLITACPEIDYPNLPQSDKDKTEGALKYYIAGKIKAQDIREKGPEGCEEIDHKFQSLMYEKACELLKLVSLCMASLSSFCEFEQLDDLGDFFGAVIMDVHGEF